MTNSPRPEPAVPLMLAGRTVLIVGPAPAEAAAMRQAGATVRATSLDERIDLANVALVLAPQHHPALTAAAERGILASALPGRKDGFGNECVSTPTKPPGKKAWGSVGDKCGSYVQTSPKRQGRVSLVGAGPGAADLLTVCAVNALRTADVVLYDKLVSAEILALARPGARMIDVGKRCGRHAMSQAAINALIERHAKAGGHVVRLKGGDPFIFGRGGEELDSLRAAGVETEVVPGITAALATAARLGIPLTHRGVARSLHLITAHGADDRLPEHDWSALARAGGTLAVYMGVRTLPLLAARLVAAGMAPSTPAIAVENASLPSERRLRADLSEIAAAVSEAAVDGPMLVLIGPVVALADTQQAAAPGQERRVAA